MISIPETEPVAPEPFHYRNVEPIPGDEEPSERPSEAPPAEPDTGRVLDTYA